MVSRSVLGKGTPQEDLSLPLTITKKEPVAESSRIKSFRGQSVVKTMEKVVRYFKGYTTLTGVGKTHFSLLPREFASRKSKEEGSVGWAPEKLV